MDSKTLLTFFHVWWLLRGRSSTACLLPGTCRLALQCLGSHTSVRLYEGERPRRVLSCFVGDAIRAPVVGVPSGHADVAPQRDISSGHVWVHARDSWEMLRVHTVGCSEPWSAPAIRGLFIGAHAVPHTSDVHALRARYGWPQHNPKTQTDPYKHAERSVRLATSLLLRSKASTHSLHQKPLCSTLDR